MKHLTKEINKCGRQIAIRVLNRSGQFDQIDEEEALSSYFVPAVFVRGVPDHGVLENVSLKFLVKASRDINGVGQFQMDEEVVRRIDEYQRTTSRRVVVVLVDTRTTVVSYHFYDVLSAGYFFAGEKFPWREPNSRQGPIWWNCIHTMTDIGEMSVNERERLIVLRTKNSADKNQKSIFDA